MASSGHYDDDTFKKEVMEEVEDSYLFGSDELFEEICISSPAMVNLSLEQRFGQLDVFNRPLCLVYTDDKMNLQIDESVLHQISLIDVPICVVGVCGVYRTGKSYLMNKLAQERTGFSLGSSIRSETKGIWVWCKPHPKVHDQVLVLLDTEGLSDPEKGDQQHDTKLFCLTMLMTSVLVYNMKGVIDQDALNRLSFITEVTKNVSVAGSAYANEEEDKSTLQIIAPHFVLCLRDFFYEGVDNGEMTPDQYMESCLTESQLKQNDDYNNIRKSIKTFFPKRKCFVMAQPAMNENLRKLETLPEDQLDANFKKDVNNMITFIQDLGPKCLDEVTRKHWDGNTFETFLRTYIRELWRGQKMEYGSAMQTAARYHNSKLKVKICREYQAKLEKMKLPEPSKLKLLDLAMVHMFDLSRSFRRDAYPFLVDHFEDKAVVTMKKMMEDLAAKNSREVNKLCYEYLLRKHEKMVQDNKSRYSSKDGVHKYDKDFDELLQKYNRKFADYDNAERCEALQNFKGSSKGQVLELKYQAKLQEEISKYEELQKSKRFDMEDFMRAEMEKLKNEQEKKLQEELDLYEKRLSKLSFGNIGFFKRVKFLFTGDIEVE